MNVRVIPRLDIKGPNLVKGIHLEGLRVLGRPEAFARAYYEQGADELLYVDVVASLYGRNSLTDIVRQTAREIFIPLCVAGGIRTVADIRTVLLAGADKVALNTAALARPDFIREAAQRFGSSTIVVSIEAIKQPSGVWHAFTDSGRQATGVDAVEWGIRAAELGAGEIMITSIDREGTGKGFELELTRKIADAVSIPVIACGGAGGVDHVRSAVVDGHADAVALASILHYDLVDRLSAEDRTASGAEGNTSFLKSGKVSSKLTGASLKTLKAAMAEARLPVRRADGSLA